MNRVAWLLAVGVLAAGSIAAAQPGLIEDPWRTSRPAVKQQRGDFRVTQRSYAFTSSGDIIVDPWRAGPPAVARASAPRAVSASVARPYVWPRAGEIIDPWAERGRRAAAPRFDALIVDPWAR